MGTCVSPCTSASEAKSGPASASPAPRQKGARREAQSWTVVQAVAGVALAVLVGAIAVRSPTNNRASKRLISKRLKRCLCKRFPGVLFSYQCTPPLPRGPAARCHPGCSLLPLQCTSQIRCRRVPGVIPSRLSAQPHHTIVVEVGPYPPRSGPREVLWRYAGVPAAGAYTRPPFSST
jgi:hypothetical protein